MKIRTAFAFAAAASLAAPALEAQTIDSLAIRAHTRFLADDLLAGRGTGSAGEHLAAAYIAAQLTLLGLQPLGEDYLLPIPMKAALIGSATAATVARDGATATFQHGPDFIVNTGGARAFHDFHGDVVFAGPPAAAHAALHALGDFRGRVIAVTAPLGAAATALVPALIEGGATGVLVLVPDTAQFELFVRSRGDRRFFVDAPVGDPVWQPDLPVILAGPSMTAALLDGTGLTRDLVQGKAGTPALPLGRSVRVRIAADVQDVRAANVAGVLPGTDPARRDELIVYTAHYDHLGVSVPDARGDTIYNGFSDNAAGVGMLLAIARALRDTPPAVSTAFLFFTGEERGLLGASFMAARPPFDLDDVRALINLDAGAPPAPPVSWRIAGGTGTPLGAKAADVAKLAGWTAVLSPASPNSDYWPFLARGVPAIFIIPGNEWEHTSATQQQELNRRWNRYHQAGDEWAADFPFSGLTRYAEFALRLGLAIAR